MSRPEDSQPAFVVVAWRRLRRLFDRMARKARSQPKAKAAAKKVPGRTWVKLRRTLKLAFAWRKPKRPARRLSVQRALRKWARRLARFRTTLSRRRYWLMVVAAVALLTGSLIAAYKVWRHEQIRRETIATVNDEPITRSELAAEVIAAGADYSQLSASARKQLLDRIIERHLLIAIAGKQGMTKDPRTAALRARADAMILANTVVQRFAGTPPPPASDEEARQFMAAHPAVFAERQTFVIDGFNCVLSTSPTNPEVVFATMDRAERYLQEVQAPYRRRLQTLDSADLPAPVTDKLLKMKPGDVFVMPQGRAALIGVIQGRVPTNTPPEIQLEAAREIVNKQNLDRRLKAAIDELRSKAVIKYSAQ
ncbi:hypothetical protein [Novosphingobium sp.]|uniref:hypothetical protein n=1 Tax=Novosphingobium sp. TaxID=1874826 RepID=UPI00263344A0|nr:hypothetical protein [Novosphingobium sp.]